MLYRNVGTKYPVRQRHISEELIPETECIQHFSPKPWRKLSLGRRKCPLQNNIKNYLKRRFAFMDWSRLLRVMNQSEWNMSFSPPPRILFVNTRRDKNSERKTTRLRLWQERQKCNEADRNTAACPTCIVTYYNSLCNTVFSLKNDSNKQQ
jgi:hypothetical protein